MFERKHCLGVLVSTPTVGPLLGSQCSMKAHVTSCGTRGGAATSQSLEPSFRGLLSEAEVGEIWSTLEGAVRCN